MSGISGNNRPFPNLPSSQKPPPRPSTPAPKAGPTTAKTTGVAKSILGALKPGGPAKMPTKAVVGKPGPTTNKVNSIAPKGFKK